MIAHISAKVDSTEEVLWVENPLTLLPAFACKEPRRMCGLGRSPDFQSEK